MQSRQAGGWGLLGLMMMAAMTRAALDAPTRIYDIPKLTGIVIDGQGADWKDQGYRVDDVRRINSPGRTIGTEARMAWDERGLLLLLDLTDADWVEARDPETLWVGDSIELTLTPRRSDPNMVQWLFTTGMDTNYPDARRKLFDRRIDEQLKSTPLGEFVYVVQKKADRSGCVVEILFPFAGLAIEPRLGREVGFQLIINDGGVAHVWYQGVKLWRNPHHVHRVRLAEAPGARDIFQVTQVKQIKNSLLMDLGIVKRGGGYPTNNAVTVRSGDGAIVTNFVHGSGRKDLRLSPPPFGQSWQKLVFEVDGENVGEYVLDTDALYQVELNKIPITFAERVFDGSTFPACDYSDPARARALIGDYTIEVRFYDANNTESSHALRPGRYGAVVTTRAGSAHMLTYVTLAHLSSISGPGHTDPVLAAIEDATVVQLAGLTGIDPKRVAANTAAIRGALKTRDAAAAKLLAALNDRSLGIDTASWSNDPEVRDNRWWLRLRHALGEDILKLSPHVFAVNTPPGYDANPDTRYGLFWYCPGRGFDCDETWEGIRVHSAHGLFRAGGARPAAPYLTAIAHSFDGYRPAEIAQMMEIIEVLYRMDPRKVFIAGHSGGAEHARKFADNYANRLAAVILMYHGPWHGRNLTGEGRPRLDNSPEAGGAFFDIDRNYAEVGNPDMKYGFDAFSQRTYDWFNSLTRVLPEDETKP